MQKQSSGYILRSSNFELPLFCLRVWKSMKTYALAPTIVPYQFKYKINNVRERCWFVLLSTLTWLHSNRWIPFPSMDCGGIGFEPFLCSLGRGRKTPPWGHFVSNWSSSSILLLAQHLRQVFYFCHSLLSITHDSSDLTSLVAQI